VILCITISGKGCFNGDLKKEGSKLNSSLLFEKQLYPIFDSDVYLNRFYGPCAYVLENEHRRRIVSDPPRIFSDLYLCIQSYSLSVSIPTGIGDFTIEPTLIVSINNDVTIGKGKGYRFYCQNRINRRW